MAKKKLREVTLGEANKICEKHDLNCLNCPLHNKQWSECSVVVF